MAAHTACFCKAEEAVKKPCQALKMALFVHEEDLFVRTAGKRCLQVRALERGD